MFLDLKKFLKKIKKNVKKVLITNIVYAIMNER